MYEYTDVEGSAKNLNDAIEDALAKAMEKLGVDREQVSYELLEKGKSGFLGLGGVTAKIRVAYECGLGSRAQKFLTGLFKLMKVEATADITEVDGQLNINLLGEDMGVLIGRRGETLDALQYITGLAINKGGDEFARVSMDTEGYREKREETLENLAKRMAEKVVKYGKSMSLEPMSPQERRVIHACLQEFPGVTTFSTGADPSRRVVIAPDKPGAQNGKPAGEARTDRPRPQNAQGDRPASGNRRPRHRRPNKSPAAPAPEAPKAE